MRVLLYQSNIHPKNGSAIQNYKNMEFVSSNNPGDIQHFDYIYSPNNPIDVQYFPNKKFIFGPHFSVFPDWKVNCIKNKNSIYIQPSTWALNAWKINPLSENLHLEVLPFGVDTDRFSPDQTTVKTEVILYTKRREDWELGFIIHYLNQHNIQYHLFNYQHRYDENHYLNILKRSKYAIILGQHESQGFAYQEAMSCNVPLFVWSVKSMNQEKGAGYDDIYAETVGYFDERCGEIIYTKDEFENKFNQFLEGINQNKYKPREYILENLSREICERRMIDLFNSIE